MALTALTATLNFMPISMPQEALEYLANLSISACCQPANRCVIQTATSPFRQGGVVDSTHIKI